MSHVTPPSRSGFWTFLVRFAVFAAPVLLVLGVVKSALWVSGDAWPAAMVVSHQQNAEAEVIYSRDFLSEHFGVYKRAGVTASAPEVVVLGSSRVMQFRAEMVAPLSFYNAGGMLQNATDLTEYASLVARGALPTPRLALISVDPWWVKRSDGEARSHLHDSDDALNPGAHIDAFRYALREGRGGEWLALLTTSRTAPQDEVKAIGSFAIRRGQGFRRDGSFQYSPLLLREAAADPRFVDRESPPIIERIRSRQLAFAPPVAFDYDKATAVTDALRSLRESGIEVWVYLPPFSTESEEALRDDPILRRWWEVYLGPFAEQLAETGASVISTPTPEAVGLDDRYMIDGFHPSEVMSGHTLLQMMEQAPDASLLREIDAENLRAMLREAETPLAFEVPTLTPEAETALREERQRSRRS
ncbi:MAG: hypothetical protein AAF791_06270 [Bacteroidota bacterium]